MITAALDLSINHRTAGLGREHWGSSQPALLPTHLFAWGDRMGWKGPQRSQNSGTTARLGWKVLKDHRTTGAQHGWVLKELRPAVLKGPHSPGRPISSPRPPDPPRPTCSAADPRGGGAELRGGRAGLPGRLILSRTLSVLREKAPNRTIRPPRRSPEPLGSGKRRWARRKAAAEAAQAPAARAARGAA